MSSEYPISEFVGDVVSSRNLDIVSILWILSITLSGLRFSGGDFERDGDLLFRTSRSRIMRSDDDECPKAKS